jgi:sortase A
MTPQRTRPKSRSRVWLERTLLIAGCACIGVWGASRVVPLLWQAWANRTFDREVHSVPPSHGLPAAPPAPLETGHLVGRLSIPRLKLSSIVREGDDETTLSLALGHIPGTALPGQTGNVGIAGHRDTIFRALRGIKKDDLIRFETLSGTETYQVDSTSIVKPADVGVLASHGKPVLTLVTCYPFYYVGSAPDRFIVSAHEVGNGPPAPASDLASVPQESRRRLHSEFHPAALKTVTRETGPSNATFEISKGEKRVIAPGISLGLTDTDPLTGRIYGWIWLAGEQRSILLRNRPESRPVVFSDGGHQLELFFTAVSGDSVRGKLLSLE